MTITELLLLILNFTGSARPEVLFVYGCLVEAKIKYN